MGMGFAPTWLRQVSPLLHKTTLTTEPPQGNQELAVVRDKVGRPPGELGVSKSMGHGM